MKIYLAEIIGTMIMLILGDGVVANVLLHKSKGSLFSANATMSESQNFADLVKQRRFRHEDSPP